MNKIIPKIKSLMSLTPEIITIWAIEYFKKKKTSIYHIYQNNSCKLTFFTILCFFKYTKLYLHNKITTTHIFL